MKMLEKLVNDVLQKNSAAGVVSKRPCTIKEIIEMARDALSVEGIADTNLQIGTVSHAVQMPQLHTLR